LLKSYVRLRLTIGRDATRREPLSVNTAAAS
jgi:hypothetical protein